MQASLAHWLVSWPLLIGYAVVAVAHLAGLRRLLAARLARFSSRLREAAAFQAGLLAVLLALVSPIGYWSPTFMWVRGLQDLLLALAAPGLIVLGAPWEPLRTIWPGGRDRAACPGPAGAGLAGGRAGGRPAGSRRGRGRRAWRCPRSSPST